MSTSSTKASSSTDGWRGIADFLERQDDGTYEAVDTKLARHAKPAHVLQLCFYSEQLARIQGAPPKLMHVELGSGERESHRPEDFGAYYRRLRRRFVAFASRRPPDRALPGLLLRALRLPHRGARRSGRAPTTSRRSPAFAGRSSSGSARPASRRSPSSPPWQDAEGTLARLRDQAALQLHARETGEQVYRLLEPMPETGFALLPEPSPGDLFFDMEGDPFWDPKGGLEYLFGVLDTDGRFTAFWAHDRESERRAFEQLVDLLHERLRADPALHVYHYAPTR